MEILLVEDNENIVNGLKYAFSKNNYNLIAKMNIKSTIDYLNNNRPELIILDVTLPDGNGFDLYKLVIKGDNNVQFKKYLYKILFIKILELTCFFVVGNINEY